MLMILFHGFVHFICVGCCALGILRVGSHSEIEYILVARLPLSPATAHATTVLSVALLVAVDEWFPL